MKWNLVFHLKRTSKEMLNLRRHYFVIWCASPLSLNPSPSIPLSWWDGWWWTCVRERKREGGRKRGIIPSEYMMNVVIGLKLTGGRVVHRDRERACEWHRAPSSTLPLQPLLVSPSSSWRETEGITQQTQQVKERMLCSFSFSTASVLNWSTKEKRKEQKQKLRTSCRWLQPTHFSPLSNKLKSLRRRGDVEQYDGLRGRRGGAQQPGWVTKHATDWLERSVFVSVRGSVGTWVRQCV